MNSQQTVLVAAATAILLCAIQSKAHADMVFIAHMDASQVVAGSTETGTGFGRFVLDSAQQNLSYTITLDGLNLVEDPNDRTQFSDVDKIHLHNSVPGSTGPHVLNIFGLPSEDDAELVVDFANNLLTGNWDDSDAIDPASGMPFSQTDPLTTKFLSLFADDLVDEQIYIGVHTIGQGGAVAIRGQLVLVPEPNVAVGILAVLWGIIAVRKRHPPAAGETNCIISPHK